MTLPVAMTGCVVPWTCWIAMVDLVTIFPLGMVLSLMILILSMMVWSTTLMTVVVVVVVVVVDDVV